MISAVTDSVISRWRSKKSTKDSSPEPSLNFPQSRSSTSPYSWFEFEVWVIDISTHRATNVLVSADWMDAKMKISRKDLEVAWSYFAKFRPYHRNTILEFLSDRRDAEPGWKLCHFEILQKWSPARLFGVRREEQMIQLTLSRSKLNDQDSDPLRGRPKIEGPGGELPKRAAFVGALGEESGESVYAMNTLDLRYKIAELEKKKKRLGPHDYKRRADLDDMIDYLRDKSGSDAKMTSIHEKSQTEPGKSESSRAPVIMPNEYIPNSNRRETIIEAERSRPRKMYLAEENSIARHRPRDEIEVIRRDYTTGELRSRGQSGVRNNSRYEPRERQEWRDEDLIVAYPDPQPRYRRERSRSRSRLSRHDSFGPRERPIIRRAQSWERLRDPMSQPSKQSSKETDYFDSAEGGGVAHDRARSKQSTSDIHDEDGEWSSDVMLIRRDERSLYRPREKQYFSNSGSEHNSPFSNVVNGGERPAVDASDQSQALVLRAGASSLPYDYVRERVSNSGIRVRGDDHMRSPPEDSPGFSDDYRDRRRTLFRSSTGPETVVSPYTRRPSRSSSSRRARYRDRSWAPSLRRRLSGTRHQLDSSEDEEFGYLSMKRVDSEKNGPETELSDAEVIAQTLKQYTTIRDSDMPATGIYPPPNRTKSEIGPSALKNASLGPERQRSFPVSGRKAHFEQNVGPPRPDQDAQSGATKEREKPADEEPFLDRISEEPDVMTEDNESLHHQRVLYFPKDPFPPPRIQKLLFHIRLILLLPPVKLHLDLSTPIRLRTALQVHQQMK